MKIEAECGVCGSKFSIDDPRGNYINNSCVADEKGRRYLVEVRVAEWLDLHQICLTKTRLREVKR